MERTWHDVVTILAGPDGEITVRDGAEADRYVVATVVFPEGHIDVKGDDEDEAWRRMAHALGEFRLLQGLDANGWTDVNEVIDQTTYIVGRDPDGLLWAIGVATAGSDLRRYIPDEIALDNRDFDRVAFLEPIDTRDVAAIVAALEASQ